MFFTKCSLCGGKDHPTGNCYWAMTLSDPGLPRNVVPISAQRKPIVVAKGKHSEKGQSRLSSFVESLFSTFVGLLIAVVATYTICKLHNIPMSWTNNFILTFWMTIISVVRQYVIRRAWNGEFWRAWAARWKYRRIDADLCCCGEKMGSAQGMCHHGGCRSAKEYAITRAVQQGLR